MIDQWRVARSVKLFEVLMPGGEWAEYIDLRLLDMSHPGYCVAGQLASMLVETGKEGVEASYDGRYWYACIALEGRFPYLQARPDWQVSHGLEIDHYDPEDSYGGLQDEWVRVIKEIQNANA